MRPVALSERGLPTACRARETLTQPISELSHSTDPDEPATSGTHHLIRLFNRLDVGNITKFARGSIAHVQETESVTSFDLRKFMMSNRGS